MSIALVDVAPGKSISDFGDGYDFKANTRYDRLVSGIAVPTPEWLPTGTTGTEQITTDETFDTDYASLLEKAQKCLANRNVKGLASPRGLTTLHIAGSAVA